ncbi:MAG: hypothetical protein WBA74_09280 [Cyclobacteriaceae bacterium]
MKVFTLLTILLSAFNLFGQNVKQDLKAYLKKNQYKIESDELIPMKEEDYNRQYFFFGFIHGARKTQEIDFQLIRSIKSRRNLRFYAPEVDFSMAYYLNKYLMTGNDSLLLSIVNLYKYAVPQDASVAFYEKIRKLKEYNDQLPDHKKISILGTDRMTSASLFLQHIKELLPDRSLLSDPVLLKLKDFDEKTVGHYTLYAKKTDFKAFLKENWDKLYENKSLRIVFGENYDNWNHLISQADYFFEEKNRREARIFENFQKLIGFRKIEDEPVYFNFGYAHVLQAKFMNYDYLAKRFKDHYSQEKVLTVLAIMSESNVLWNTKVDKNGRYKGYGINWFGGEGDSIIERVNGISTLKRVTPMRSAAIYDLRGADSPVDKDLYFIYTKKQLKKYRTDEITTDYIQYLIHIRNAKANKPIQEII